MIVLLVPVAALVSLVLYNVGFAVSTGKQPIDGLITTMNFFEQVVFPSLISILILAASRYSYRWFLYSRNGAILHPNYESFYQYLTSLLYLLAGLYQVYLRFCYSILSSSWRIGQFDIDLIGHGQDYSYHSYLGLLESIRLKNEYEAMVLDACVGLDLHPLGKEESLKRRREREVEVEQEDNVVKSAESSSLGLVVENFAFGVEEKVHRQMLSMEMEPRER